MRMINLGFLSFSVVWLPGCHIQHTAWFVSNVSMVTMQLGLLITLQGSQQSPIKKRWF